MNNIKNKKIIVTGSAGFIGSFVCLKLLERGNDVIGIDNNLKKINNLKKKK